MKLSLLNLVIKIIKISLIKCLLISKVLGKDPATKWNLPEKQECFVSIFYHCRFIVQFSEIPFIMKSIQMIEPLLLKSVPSQRSDQTKKNYIFTVSQLMQKFEIKSPARNNQCLTDRVCSTTKHCNAATNERMINLAMPKKNSEQTRSSILREIKIGTPRNNEEPKRQIQNKKTTTLTRSTQSCKENPFNIIKKNSKKQAGSSKQKSIPMFKLPLSNIKKTEDLSLTNKIQLNINIHRQTKKKKENIIPIKKQKIPQSTRVISDEKFFRKSTNASTVSLKSKHTISMQHLEEESDILFSKYIASSQMLPAIKKSGEDMISKLEQTKQKIYQHIYSLDKKLLDQFDIGEGKKALVICLKKRNQKQQQKNINQGVSA